ncbi:unnamed protein product [Polarella glacialis]|uniref:Cyclic nucleotide-binding domain-containing protein n=1 Tax=Polarella glacialis TaxID=89957 RepID=A0A813KNG9_POLGL|nr:unnamed protein product [Polarella glacialis]
MIAIPWMMAWDIDLQTGIRQSFLATTLYWTADIVFSSFTGFYHDGIIERRLALISRKYVKGWFFMDLLMVVSDWVSFAATELSDGTDASTTTGLKLVRFLKLAKFLRILGLMRMIRFSKLFEELLDRSLAGGFRVVFDFVKLLCFVLWLSHVTTCLWFLLGMNGPSDTDSRWFDSVMMRSGDHFEAAAQGYQYATSFHFALSQITANGVEMLSPLNSIERWFNIVCLIFGLFFSSHVVSTFSSAMMQLEMANEDKTHKLKQLNTFLSQYPVDKGVARRCQRQIKERMNGGRRLTEDDVPALSLLSAALLKELRFSVSGESILTHPLFRCCSNIDESTVQEICDEAVKIVVLQAGDSVFFPGEEASSAYILNSGSLTYAADKDFCPEADGEVDVKIGKWLSESTLWCRWRHVGEAHAGSVCQLFALDAERLNDTVDKFEHITH